MTTEVNSQLLFRRQELDPAGKLVAIGLHDKFGTMSDPLPIAAGLPGVRTVYSLQAARPVGAGIAFGGSPGFMWYLAEQPEHPEPSTFGDSLIQLEDFLIRVSGRYGPPLLFGLGQGGVMALTLAQVWPERLTGVAVLDAGLAQLSWSPPPRPLAGLPILLAASQQTSQIEASRDALVELGAQVELAQMRARDEFGSTLAEWTGKLNSRP